MAWSDFLRTKQDLAEDCARWEADECLDSSTSEQQRDNFVQQSSEVHLEHFSKRQMIDILEEYRKGE